MTLSAALTELVALFNAQKTDLPRNAIHKDCVFRLNGRAYHETLGRPIDDPLVRLIGCGPGAYRLLLTAIRYAVNEPRLLVRPFDSEELQPNGASSLTIRATLTGELRGSEMPLRAECAIAISGDPQGRVREIAVTMGDADIALITAARRRE